MDILAPISGVITDQEVTIAATVQSYSSPNPFTISDLSMVWIVCNVYENDMANVRMGEPANVKLNAFPDEVLNGTVSNIGAILDPNIRTAKVRLEVPNPNGMMRPGMFATATFYSPENIPTPLCPRPRSCICTIVTGSSFPRRENSAEPKSPAAPSCRTGCRKF